MEQAENEGSGGEDFNVFLHSLRSRELERLPPGASVVLSGGAAGSWYFDWFESHYPTPIDRHIGVEAFAPRPADLPAHVDWIASSLGDLRAVKSGTVDLVFGGEVIEHLWPDDIVGFLCGAHRVLRPAGRIALDSPNRRISEAIGWLHPEHTVEFSVDEIVELLDLAGFDDVLMRGVLLGYDADRHRYLPLHDVDLSREERVARATDDPENAFVWWAQAVRSRRAPNAPALTQRVWELFSRFRRARFGHLHSAIGQVYEMPHDGRVVHARRGESGPMLFGPYAPMPPGQWEATFEVSAPSTVSLAADEQVGWIDVVSGADASSPLASLNLPAGVLGDAGQWSRHSVQFSLDETTHGLEFRVFSNGAADFTARSSVDVRPTQLQPVPRARPTRASMRARVLAALRGEPSYRAVARRLVARLRRL